MLTHKYDYRSNLEASQKVNWKLEDVIGGRTFDFARPFLPESLAGVNGIRCLNAAEKLKLNQIRGFTYLYLFGLCEEYILPSVIEHAEGSAHGDDYEMRALLRFAEEEAKHIQLFKWFVKEFEKGFGTPCGAIGPAKEIAAAILNHSRLGRLPRHAANRMDDAEALHGEREGQRRGAARSALLQPASSTTGSRRASTPSSTRSSSTRSRARSSRRRSRRASTTTWTSARCSTAA